MLSGVNRGANLGEDVTYSGTVAAAMEATLLGIPAIALSQVRKGDTLHWETAEKFGAGDHPPALCRSLAEGVLMNVNFPPVPPEQVTGIKVARAGPPRSSIRRSRGARTRAGRDMLWIGDFPTDDPQDPNTDLGAILENMVVGDAAAFRPRPTCDLARRSPAGSPTLKPAKAARKRAAG